MPIGCLSCIRPRYKQMVDEIYSSALLQNDSVYAYITSLAFYVLTSPEKLDCIGEYVFQKANRDFSLKRYKSVVFAMEILETLLFVCHAHIKKTNSLNNFLLNSSFVASYLQSVLKVLESGELDLQLDAALALVRFSDEEEHYVSKSSSTRVNNYPNLASILLEIKHVSTLIPPHYIPFL